MKQSFSLTKIISVLLLAAVLLSVSSCKRVEPQISDKKVSLDISVHSEDDAASMIYLFLCPQGASGKDDIKKLIITRNSENSWNVENDYGQEELNDIGEHGRLYAIYTEGKQRAFEESADGWGISGSGYGETQTCGTDYSIRNRCLSADIRLEKTGTQILISHLDTDDGWELSTAQDGSVRKLNAISNISVSRNGIILKCGESTICGQTKSDTEVFHIGKDEYDTKPLVITLKNLRNGKSYSRNFGETALRGKDACELEGPELDADGAFINSHGWEQSHEDRNKIFYRLHPSSAKLEGYAEGEGKDMFAAKITAHNYDPETGYGEIIFDSPVTKIGTDAFMEQSSIVSLTIPETVTSLDERAFALCPSLESINIPSGVTSFGRGLFYGCESLTSIDIPDGITEINDLVFQYCTSLSKVDIPQGVTRIGIQAFAVCTGLTDIHIPGKVTSIADCAFAECTGLTEITLPEGLKTIGNAAFGGCSNMESFNIPETVSEISAQAFYYWLDSSC